MERHWIYVSLFAVSLICGAATAQETKSDEGVCQDAYDVSPASKACDAAVDVNKPGNSQGKRSGTCSGTAKCGEGAYHLLNQLSVDDTRHLVACNGKVTLVRDAAASCLTQEQQDALRAEKAAAAAQLEADKSSCNEAWKESSSSTSCTARVDSSGNGICSVNGQCQPENQESVLQALSIEQTKALANCNGKLQVGECKPGKAGWVNFQHFQAKATAAQSLYESHDAACLAAWNASSAHATCTTVEFIKRDDGSMCRIHAQCGSGAGPVSVEWGNMEFTESGGLKISTPEKRESFMTISEEDVKKLTNCSGYLKVGPCD
jgi:hypothetical protein